MSASDVSGATLSDGFSAALARAQALDQPAFITLLTAEQSRQLSAPDGWLAGLTFAVKDNIDVAGTVTSAGNPNTKTLAVRTATSVQRLLDAGAVLVGKTNLDQYATGLVGTRSPYGACHSVFSAEHVSGGSSSGSAVVVAAEVVDFALGTDTAGSGRVPAAFNGLVGLKPTKGLVSTTGVLPACRSLDCVSIFTRTVAMARRVLDVLAGYDEHDAYSRSPKVVPGWPTRPRIGVPTVELGLDPLQQRAFEAAVAHAATIGDVIPIDVQPFLQVAELLYSGPWVAERAAAFGDLLDDGPGIDPTVRQIVAGAAGISATDTFRGMYALAELRRQTEPAWQEIDCLLLPVTPTHPTLAAVAEQPIAANSELGRFTNMTNLLDLAAIAIPAGLRSDGLPFGVQFLAPAFTEQQLLRLATHWTGESVLSGYVEATGLMIKNTLLLAVAGAHLTGQPLNHQLTDRGAVLQRTTRTAPEYRMYLVDGPLPRPGLTKLPAGASGITSDQPGIEVEVWEMPAAELGSFALGIAAPLGLGETQLIDGQQVLGFICTADGVDPVRDISHWGGWRSYLAGS